MLDLSFFNNILINTPAGAHGLLEFGFFLAVGITAGSLGSVAPLRPAPPVHRVGVKHERRVVQEHEVHEQHDAQEDDHRRPLDPEHRRRERAKREQEHQEDRQAVAERHGCILYGCADVSTVAPTCLRFHRRARVCPMDGWS